MIDPFSALLLMIVGHFIADYPLQGDFLAKAKNHTNPIPGVPWYQALAAHAIIHGGFVGIITGIWWLGLFEAIIHAVIDYYKCSGCLSYNLDQLLHLYCKIGWALLLIGISL